MRVAVLTRVCFPYHGFGGSERHIYHLLKHLKRLGVGLSLYTTPPRSGWREATFPFYREVDVPVQFVKARLLPLGRMRGTVILDRALNYPRLAGRMGRLVAREVKAGRVDIVYSQGITGLGYGIRRRLGRLKPPLVHNPQGMEEFKTLNRPKWLAYAPLRFYARRTARLANCVVATDDCMVPEVRAYLKTDRIWVLRNGVDLDEIGRFVMKSEQEALVSQFELHETDCIGVTVSRLEENKGIHVLLEALSRLPGSSSEAASRSVPPSWKWFLVGDGSHASRLHAQCRQLGLDGRVVFLGTVGDSVLHNLYELADVFCLPSLYEGSSIATLEAMAHKCALVASAVGGVPDKIVEGVNGFLTEPGSVDSIHRKIETLMLNRDLRRGMAEASTRLILEKFSWEVVARDAIALFEDLIRRQASGALR
ncbi:MAG: glycosyltransferase family 4 protein [Acidobacteriota bacterium]